MKNYNGTDLLKELCEINGPSGFEYKVAEFISAETSTYKSHSCLAKAMC